MLPEIAKLVGAASQPTGVTDLFEMCRRLVKLSRDEMCKYYDPWDYFDQVYRGERKADLQDHQAVKRGEPGKIVLPLTFGQVQTFVAFGHAVYNQADYFYEMDATGAEDEKPGQIASALLEQNLRKNKFRSTRNIQFLTDIAKYGLGVTKETWVHDQCPVMTEEIDQAAMTKAQQGLAQVAVPPTKKVMTLATKYMGNKVVNVSPYRWFPDPRLPLTRWGEGEFCADEVEESVSKMKWLERQGTVAGIEYVPMLPMDAFEGRRMAFFNKNDVAQNTKPAFFLLTEVQIRLNPAETEVSPGVFLDKDRDYETIYIVWILNDSRIVRISEAGYDHEEFGYNCAQFLDDQNRFVNLSLCEVLSACQDTATWFINSHITSVRKTVFNQFVADPSGIEIDDIINRSPVIRTKPGRAGSGVDQWLKQLQVTDVTANHISDVTSLSGMAKEATGINETLLGQFSSGRRSAKEAGNVANNAAQRLLMIFSAIWESAYGPMGAKMLSNLRQGLDEATVVRIYGQINTQEAAQPDLPGLPPPLYRLIKVSKQDLVGNYDLAPLNATTPSARAQTAGVLKELLSEMQADPRMVVLTGLDPKLIFFEILNLLNIRNVQRFRLTPERLQQLSLLAQPTANPSSPGGTPAGVNGASGNNGRANTGAGPRTIAR